MFLLGEVGCFAYSLSCASHNDADSGVGGWTATAFDGPPDNAMSACAALSANRLLYRKAMSDADVTET